MLDGEKIPLTSKEEEALKIEQERQKKEDEENAKIAYKKQRKFRYPEIGDQLDDLFKQNLFSEEMTKLIQQVKTDFPKPK